MVPTRFAGSSSATGFFKVTQTEIAGASVADDQLAGALKFGHELKKLEVKIPTRTIQWLSNGLLYPTYRSP